MENPEKEIAFVVQQLTAESPDIQKAAFEKYIAPNVSFLHPVCAVASGPNSREELLGIYQYMVFSFIKSCTRLTGRGRWYRILSPQIDIAVGSIGKHPRTIRC